MLLLGLDTATPAVTVALHDGGQPLAQLVTVDAHRHAELLAPAIAKVIADAGADRADLTGIAVGVGPGPYTGLRVGVVTAKVLGAALGIPVYGVCTLDVIAAGVDIEPPFAVATDARRKEVYWARYGETGRSAGPEVDRPAEVPRHLNVNHMPVAGEGPLIYPEHFPFGIAPTYPAAATLCRIVSAALADGEPAADDTRAGVGSRRVLLPPEPLYLRRPDAREPRPPKRVTP